MKDLVEASGLPKSTILYYAEKGLLPPPRKTSPNMAYYDPACVERIDSIRNMQYNYHLPLDKIGRFLERRDRGENIMPLVELGRAVFGEDRGPLVDEEGFRQATGLSAEEMEKLAAARLLLPLQDGKFDQADVAMGKGDHGAARPIVPFRAFSPSCRGGCGDKGRSEISRKHGRGLLPRVRRRPGYGRGGIP